MRGNTKYPLSRNTLINLFLTFSASWPSSFCKAGATTAPMRATPITITKTEIFPIVSRNGFVKSIWITGGIWRIPLKIPNDDGCFSLLNRRCLRVDCLLT